MKKILFSLMFFLTFHPLKGAGIDDVRLLTEVYPPFQFYKSNDSKVISGIYIDLVEEMLKELGSKRRRADLEVYPWARSYKLLQNPRGELICLFSMSRTKQRESLFKWVGPGPGITLVLIGLKKNKLKINKSSDAHKLKVGAIRDDVGEQKVLELGVPKESLLRANNIKQSIRQLVNGRVQVISYNKFSAFETIKKVGHDPEKFEVVYTISESDAWFGFSKNVPDKIVNNYQRALDSVKEKGLYDKIIKMYETE